MKTCYIFGALPVEKLPFLPQPEDFVIAADGGLRTLDNLKIVPELIIGDFDSLGYVPKRENILQLPVRKDDTDVGIAIKTALCKNYRRIIVYGATGGKLDHTFANVQLAGFAAEKGCDIIFVGKDVCFTVIKNSSIRFPLLSGRFSVFSISEKAINVTIKGASFGLDNAELTSLFPLGVSNKGMNNPVFISVESGIVAIFWEDFIMPDFRV